MSAQLIPEARKAWRMLTMQLAAVAVVFGVLPPDQQLAILSWIGLPPERLPLVLGLGVMVARLVRQPAVEAGRPDA